MLRKQGHRCTGSRLRSGVFGALCLAASFVALSFHAAPVHPVETRASRSSPTIAEHLTGNSRAPSCRYLPVDPNVSAEIALIEICGDVTCDEVTVRIRPATWPRERPVLSADAETNSKLAEIFGPNLFRLRFEGPTAFVITPWPVHDAKEYQARVPGHFFYRGVYTLAWEWLYKDFAAVNELHRIWPPLLKRSLLREDKRYRTKYHRQQCTVPSVEQMRCETLPSWPQVESRPLCNGRESEFSGVWIKNSSVASIFTRVRVRKIRKEPSILFEWALQADYDWRWVPHACRVSRTSGLLFSRRVAPRRIVIGGDSQQRALYFGMVNILSGNEMACVRNVSTLLAEPDICIPNVKGSHRKNIQGVQVDFVDDVFLDKLTGDRYASYDIIVAGFGQHPASKEHWSLNKFAAAASNRVRRMKQLQDKGKIVVWYGAPQYPHTKQGYPVVVRDWRTDARLMLFNSVAYKLSRNAGLRILDAFNVTTHMSHTSPDQAHYSNFVSAELVHLLFTIICDALQADCENDIRYP